MNTSFTRVHCTILKKRLSEERRYIQVLSGPRQSGKTTIALQTAELLRGEVHYASADEPSLKNSVWIEQQWETARFLLQSSKTKRIFLLLDEIQKIPQWSETVKKLWDADTRKKIPLQVVLLGSSQLLLHKGLSESLAGRFEILPVTHWFFHEMQEAFGWNLEQYIFYGGYPGAVSLINEPERWKKYINDSLIETTVARDILLLNRVDKPALLRQLFHLGCSYSGQIVSYQKLVGQLQDAGNTTTLAHYLSLLSGAGMITGLEKFSVQKIRQRSSSPKLLVLNTALLSAQSDISFGEAKHDREFWGRLVESAVGAHLVNSAMSISAKLFYWREGAKEVDFILQQGKTITAIEVKSGRKRESIAGIHKFSKLYPAAKKILVGADGIPLERFLQSPFQ